MADKITRIAIVDSNRCKPKRCAQECKKVCPVAHQVGDLSLMHTVSVLSSGENGYERTVLWGIEKGTDNVEQANSVSRSSPPTKSHSFPSSCASVVVFASKSEHL